MKHLALALALTFVAAPVSAQLGGLSGVLEKADKVKRLSDVRITDQEERAIGEEVSARIVDEFGVFQDAAVARYVSLVGGVLAQVSARPGLAWEFIVLDTDGVNAFAAPGGLVHVTRGLLGLMENEAELAGVLAHEIVHVTEKHTVNSIQKGGLVQFGTDEVSASGGLTQSLASKIAQAAYDNVLNNRFDRGDEGEADEIGVQLANKVGYAPNGLSSALAKLAERNAGRQEPSGLFASHPLIKDRVSRIARTINGRALAAKATVEARYAAAITFDARPISEVALVADGSRGLAGGDTQKKDAGTTKAGDSKPEEKKSGGGLLRGFRVTGGKQAQNEQTVASAGARGVNPDRDAVGGTDKNKVRVTISPADLAEFRKGIA
ncbi:MAG TPA: M48 family metalloprotease [Vicinamibacterales bacterium]|nr:M48 family metalloprotease [Vicinamibacterales bacterium]